MDRITKSFIMASLAWLSLGAALGVAMTFGWGSPAYFRFAHLHMLLLGFMAMMVYGVGYFILPRFNGTTLRWPWLTGPHFWIANLSLFGLVFAAAEFRPLFAVLSLAGVLIFAGNMAATLLWAPILDQRLAAKGLPVATAGAQASPTMHVQSPTVTPVAAMAAASGPVSLTGNETIGELLERHPQLDETIRLFFGDGCFSCPGQATESLTQAAMMHNIDPELLREALQERLQR